MKISYQWLKDLVDINMDVKALAHTLTMAGLEVEEITPVAAQFDKIVVAEVKTTAPHPNADKLRVCEVDAGTGAVLQIVCGAPNVAPGMRVPCALVGAKLPGLEIKQAKLRGVESNGMLCSARELGLSDEHSGLLALPNDAPIGQDIRQYLNLDDTYLTLKLTPNRGDCLSVHGVARDLAVVTGAKLTLPMIAPVANTGVALEGMSRAINIDATNACGRYCGRVIRNINPNAPTPAWMVQRLERAGFRSISALVDITNFLTLERGRPMHAFDNDKLTGAITVRFAKQGENLKLLNEQEVALKPDMLLIADERGPLALGGVMGGWSSMVGSETTNVFFEAAWFDPAVIQGKTRELGINSDAAFRFERGVDPESARDGIEYATQLTLGICGTPETSIGAVVEALGGLPVRQQVTIRPARVASIIGTPVTEHDIEDVLQRLQCVVEKRDGRYLATPPSWRFDLAIEEDFIEEVARIKGFDKIPAEVPRSIIPMLPSGEGARTRSHLRRHMVDCGYQEVINYSFVSDTWEADFAGNLAPVKLANPIASHMNVMRTTLIGGLIESLKSNLNRGEARLRLFEIGRCFFSDKADLAAQPEKIAGLAFGARYPEQWGEAKDECVDFFSIKGEIENLCAGLNIKFEKASLTACHPGRSAAITLAGNTIGLIGELHPKLQQKYGLISAPIIFELLTEPLLTVTAPRYIEISRMQAIRRDIAMVVDESISVQAIIDATLTKIPIGVTEFSLFDQYQGASLENGRKSLAFRVVMQDTARTLTDVEADEKVAIIIKVIIEQFNATIRK